MWSFYLRINKLNVLPPILIGYKPSTGKINFLVNYISNITNTNQLSLFEQSTNSLNFAQNKFVIEC